MSSWAEFEHEAPELAAAGRRLLVGPDDVAIAFLATASASSTPHLAPVCPIFCDDHVYVCAARSSPKVRDLRANPRFVLHAFLGPNDEEFQALGDATELSDTAERARVHDAIPFASFQTEDPIFRLALERVLWVHWERAGEPDTRPIRRRWRSSSSRRRERTSR